MNWANIISNVIAALSLTMAILAWREAHKATQANDRSIQLAERGEIDKLIPRKFALPTPMAQGSGVLWVCLVRDVMADSEVQARTPRSWGFHGLMTRTDARACRPSSPIPALASGQPEPGASDQDQGDGEADGDGGKAFNRSKLVRDRYPERSIRVSPRQAERGPILCGICDGEFHPEDGPR